MFQQRCGAIDTPRIQHGPDPVRREIANLGIGHLDGDHVERGGANAGGMKRVAIGENDTNDSRVRGLGSASGQG